jgi:AcrR family transcriptional regulator
VVSKQLSAQQKFRRLGPDERRRSLIEATRICFARYGPHGTGVREICRQADVSPGLLRHYFDGKDALILETFRVLTQEFYQGIRIALEAPEASAEDRIGGFFDSYFSQELTEEEPFGAYLAFWMLARTDPAVRRIQRASYRKHRRLLEPVLTALADQRGVRVDAAEVAVGLIALLDGLWLGVCVDPRTLPRAQTNGMAWAWLDAYFQRGTRAHGAEWSAVGRR